MAQVRALESGTECRRRSFLEGTGTWCANLTLGSGRLSGLPGETFSPQRA